MTAFADDPRLADARALSIAEVANNLGLDGLKRAGQEIVGPCPSCGGRDRFSINDDRGVYNCRQCGGGDVIGLVELAMACDFKAALAWLVGERDLSLSPAERERRAEAAAQKARARADQAAAARDKAIRWAQTLFAEGKPMAGSPAAEYLTRRGVGRLGTHPAALRYHPALPYTVKRSSGWEVVHTGPGLLAGVLSPGGQLIGTHRTWIDLNQPKGKAVLFDGETQLKAKKMAGSMKGGAIRLTHEAEGFETLVVAEGIETTLTAQIADAYPGAAYWCGVSLGNMAGRAVNGKGLKYAGIPDLKDDEAWVPPPWVKRLIFIMDGDSEPRLTRHKLTCGLRRARAVVPGLQTIQIAAAPDGKDLNDILMEATDAS